MDVNDQKVDLALLVDRCLDQLAGGADLEQCLEMAGAYRDEIEPVLRAAIRLNALRDIRPSDEQLTVGEASVLAAIATDEETTVTKPRLARPFPQKRQVDWARQPRRYSMTALVSALALVLAIACGGTVEASQSALPGQPLYGVKTLTEAARLAAARDEVARLQLQLRFADERLEEMQQLAERGADAAMVGAADAYVSSTNAAAAYCATSVNGDCEQLLIRLRQHQETLLQLQTRLGTHEGGDMSAVQAVNRALTNCEALQQRTRERLQLRQGRQGNQTATQQPANAPTQDATPIAGGGNSEPQRDQDRDRVRTCTVTPSCTPLATGTGDQTRNRAGQDAAGSQTPAATVAPTVMPPAQQEQGRQRGEATTNTPVPAQPTAAQNQEQNQVQAGGEQQPPQSGAQEQNQEQGSAPAAADAGSQPQSAADSGRQAGGR